MTLRDLSKPQRDAAMAAADLLMKGSPDREGDRRRYADALIRFEAMLPDGEDARAIVREAMRWQVLGFIAEIEAGLPVEAVRV